MDMLPISETSPQPKAPGAPAKKSAAPAPGAAPGYATDAVDAARMSEVVNTARSKPAELTPEQFQAIAAKKATCPFIGSAVAMKDLPVRNSADKPLASIDDVVALGNSGGGDLGEVLKLFAEGNHAKMVGNHAGTLDAPVPGGLFSLDFPGSQGSHPGHSGILQSNPKQMDSGRFSQADYNRLISRAKNGYLKRSDIAAFIAENLAKDPNAKVFGTNAAFPLAGDLARVAGQSGPALLQSLKNTVTGARNSDQERQLTVALTKTLGEDNLVGSSGEFGLLMAFLAHSPRSKTIDGEPAVSVADVQAMFQEHRLPDGWEKWPKTRHDWLVNTSALTLEAAKDYATRNKKPTKS